MNEDQICPHGVNLRMATCCVCADPAFHAASRNNPGPFQKFSLHEITGLAETAQARIAALESSLAAAQEEVKRQMDIVVQMRKLNSSVIERAAAAESEMHRRDLRRDELRARAAAAERQLERAREIMKYIDSVGGCGYVIHNWISAFLANGGEP